MSIFYDIRDACARIAARARHVRIEEQAVDAAAAALTPADLVRHTPADPRCCFEEGDEEAKCAFVLIRNSLRFGAGWFDSLYIPDEFGGSGHAFVAARLADRFRDAGPLTAAELLGMTVEDAASLFGQSAANKDAVELMGLYAAAMQDLGRQVAGNYFASFASLVRDAQHSAAGLVNILKRLKFYQDVSSHHSQPAPFFKRAQQAAADLGTIFRREGLGGMYDIEEMTAPAGARLPYILRIHGVLTLTEALAERVDHGEPLESGDEEEVELRAVALHAVERIKQQQQYEGVRASSTGIAQALFLVKVPPSASAMQPHHARCVHY